MRPLGGHRTDMSSPESYSSRDLHKDAWDTRAPATAEDQLDLYRAIIANSSEAIAIIDKEGYYLEQNCAHREMIGYSDAELAGKTPAIHMGEKAFAHVADRLARGESYSGELRIRTKDGRLLDIELSAFRVDRTGCEPVYVGIKRDITARKESNRSLRRRHEHLKQLYHLSSALARAAALDEVCDTAMKALRAALGADRAAVLLFDDDGVMRFKAWDGLSDDYRAAVEGHSPWGRDAVQPQPIVIPNVEADASLGALLPVLSAEGILAVVFVPLVYEGRLVGKLMLYYNRPRHMVDDELQTAQAIASHVALAIERKRSEAELASHQAEILALNERLQRAMTETHHRVKNNLQIVAAMVDLQLLDRPETVPAEELRRLSRHVRALAVVHELLTRQARQDGSAHDVSARDILEQLLPIIQQTSPGRTIRYQLDEARLSVRQGTSLVLVTNELISNAVKYGRQAVDVELAVVDGSAVLTVCDDGPGFPEGFNVAAFASTGLDLVTNLVRWDLEGQATYGNRREGGACVTVRIPLLRTAG